MSDKATARPLVQGPYYKFDVLDAQGSTFATARPEFTPDGEKRAALIVRAVNNAERLIEDMRKILAYSTGAVSDAAVKQAKLDDCASVARTALAAWEEAI